MPEETKLPPLWEYVRLSEFKVPAEPTGESVRKGFSALWQRLSSFREEEPSEPVQKDLEAAGGEMLKRLAPPPDWEAAAEALSSLPGLEEESGTTLLVGAPGDGAAETVRLMAGRGGWTVLEAPSFEEILDGAGERLNGVDWEAAEPLAIPRLEGFFLRQFDGLEAIRRLLDRLIQSERPCLVACGSWAWAFLVKSERIDGALPSPFALQAFDSHKLGRWFRELAVEAWDEEIQFRKADNGKRVLPKLKEDDSESRSSFLKQLAAHTRGHPGVAIELWRRGLGVSPPEDAEQVEEMEGRHPNTIWVSRWADLQLPEAPASTRRIEKFLLHLLLLHDGLGMDAIRHALTLDRTEAPVALAALRRRRLIDLEGGVWRVTHAAYPTVRHFLKSEDYLTDSL